MAQPQSKMQPGKPLPTGLEKSGLTVWNLLSETQQKTAKEYGLIDGDYYTRFCELMNHPSIDTSIIQKGGVLNGLDFNGKKIWEMLDPDVQLEVFLTSSYGTSENIRKFINASWEQHKMGKLTVAQIEHGIQTLASEVEEVINIFLNSFQGKKNTSHKTGDSKGK